MTSMNPPPPQAVQRTACPPRRTASYTLVSEPNPVLGSRCDQVSPLPVREVDGIVDDASAMVEILRRGPYLVVSIHTALDDTEDDTEDDTDMVQLSRDLVEAIGRHGARGVVIDVASLNVHDFIGSRTVRDIAETAQLLGAAAVIVGIQPDLACAMVSRGMSIGSVPTALDLEEGLDVLDHSIRAMDGRANEPPGSASRRRFGDPPST